MSDTSPQSYIALINEPAEKYFLTEKQVKQIQDNITKMQNTKAFISKVLEQEDFEDLIEKAVNEGRIFTPSQVAIVEAQSRVFDEKDGSRVDINQTLVSPSGQRIISSRQFQEETGYDFDTYILKDEREDILHALRLEGLPQPEIDKVSSAMEKYGAVLVQRGIFVDVKNILEDAIGRTLSLNYGVSNADIRGGKVAATAASDELPISFIEYLKNNEKEYDRVEHEIIADQQFQSFFASLKKNYSFYQNMAEEKMAQEVIIRPQLWSKISPQTKAWIQTLVEKHRQEFVSKIREVANAAHLEKLEELKSTIAK